MEPAFGKDLAAWTARDPLHMSQVLMARRDAGAPAMYLDWGNADPYVAQNRYFARAAQAAGLSVTYAEFPGGHDWDFWRLHVAHSARWLATRIATP